MFSLSNIIVIVTIMLLPCIALSGEQGALPPLEVSSKEQCSLQGTEPSFKKDETRTSSAFKTAKLFVIAPLKATTSAWEWLEKISKPSNKRTRKVPKETIRKVVVVATAYSAPSKRQETNMTTATGRKVRTKDGKPVRGIAADPRVIPLGSLVKVPAWDNKWHLVDDVGGAIKGYKIDIRMDTEKECFQWGRRKITILVKEKVNVRKTRGSSKSSKSNK